MNSTELIMMANVETRRLSSLLIGFAGAAIAFAFHETSSWPATSTLILVALAVVLWSISFAAGILWAHAARDATILNAAAFEARQNPGRMAEVETRLSKAQNQTTWRYKCQLMTLGFGAIVYAAGFVVHVYDQLDAASVHETAPKPTGKKS